MYQPVIAGVSLATNPGVSLLGIVLVPSQQSLSVIGTATPNESVQVFLDGTSLGTASVDGQGNWTYSDVPSSSTVASGVYAFSAVTTDASGNVSSPSPVIPIQIGGSRAPTAATPRYTSGKLSGQATAGQSGHHRQR